MSLPESFKSAPLNHAYWVLLAILQFTCGFATGAPPPPKPPEPVETHWPGITVTVQQIARLPGNRISVKFLYRASSNAPAETYIADRPLKGFTGEPTTPGGEPTKFAPYSLEKKGQLIEEATGLAYPAAELMPGDAVDPGRMDAMELLRPNDGFYLGAVFKCPALNQDDPPKEQWVSFNLPGLKKNLTGILLPREENVLLDFYPRRRPRPAPATQ